MDRQDNTRDALHEYIQLNSPVTARYARLTNIRTPYGATFSVSGLRLFGSGLAKSPAMPRRSYRATPDKSPPGSRKLEAGP
ncbi:MAG: hypothetical protein ACAI35_08405 [Candidatus Methylacidiphilales bacterium]